MVKLKYGRHSSAIKEHRKTIVRTQRNKAIKERIKNVVKQLKKAVENKNVDSSTKLLNDAYSLIDKACKKNIFKPNTIAGKKSRIAKLVNTLTTKT